MIPLLATKLYIPAPSPNQVPRPQLVERLERGLHLGRRLTLISAPAGFGKTTLLGEWAASSHYPIAWLSLDEGDNDPARFWAYFVAALRAIETRQDGPGGFGILGEGLVTAFQTPKPPPLESVLTALLNEIAALPPADAAAYAAAHAAAPAGASAGCSFALVLDDYHAIDTPAIHEGLAFLLDHLPLQMQLVIATRSDPPLPLACLRARGQLTELRQSDLRFTADQIAEFLNQVARLELPGEEVAALGSRTEGWIAGLQMAAISIQGRKRIRGGQSVSGFIQSLTGSHRFILDYLVEEVLEQQSAAIQEFLLKTSVLERLTGPLCDALLALAPEQDQRPGPDGHSPSQQVLEQLEAANLFIVPLDDERRWYRYHHLFADLLRRRLQQASPALVSTLHQRASIWCEQNGQVAAAIEHALAAGDAGRATHLVEGAAEPWMLRSELATLRKWVEALPEEMVRARPLLCVYHAFALLLSGRPLEVAEARLQDGSQSDTTGAVSGEVMAFRALLASYQGNAQQSTELSRRALALIPEDRLFFRSFVTGFSGLAFLYKGEIAAAERAFREAVKLGQQTGNLTITVLAMCHLAELSGVRGKLYEAKELYEQAVQLTLDSQGRRRPIAGLALIGLGQVFRERNDLEAARRYYVEGIELINRWGEVGALQGYTGLARVKLVQGDMQGAREELHKARQLAVKFDAMEVDDLVVEMNQGRIWIAEGDIEAASRWVDARDLESQVGLTLEGWEELIHRAPIPYYFVNNYMIWANVRLAQGKPDRVPAVFGHLRTIAETAGWGAIVVRLLIVEALALQALGDIEQALTRLERALSLGRQGGAVRTFLDEGEPLARLLRHAASRGIAPEYVRALLAAYEAQAHKGVGGPPPPTRAQPLIEPLSERELEVLRLLAAGLSNPEIAQELFIAVSTVRSHLKSIYGKLNVHKRWDAVQRAEELELL